jgi:hypothetical protein
MKFLSLTLSLFFCLDAAHAQTAQTMQRRREIQAAQVLCHGMAAFIVKETDPTPADDRCARASPTVYCCSPVAKRNDTIRDSNGNTYYPIRSNGRYHPNARPAAKECHYIQHCEGGGYMGPPSCGPQLVCSYDPGLY